MPGTEGLVRIGQRTVVEIVKEGPSLLQIEETKKSTLNNEKNNSEDSLSLPEILIF